MARQTSDIFVRLNLENVDGIDKLKSAFRDLDRTLGISSQTIDTARQRLNEYVAGTTRSEQLIRGQISALQGLRSQVSLSGDTYAELTLEIAQLHGELRGSSDILERQRRALTATGEQNSRSVRVLQQHRDALVQLQNQTRLNSEAYTSFGADIERVSSRIEETIEITKRLRQALSRAIPGTAAGAEARISSLTQGIEVQRQIIADIDLLVPKERKAAEAVRNRAAAEQELNAALLQRRQLTFQESARTGRENVRTAAAAFADPLMTAGYLSMENIGRRLGGLPDTTAGLNQELSELSERLINTARGSSDYVAVAMRMAEVQRQLNTDIMGTAEAFRRMGIAQEGVERRAGKVADVQQYYGGPGVRTTAGERYPQVGPRDPLTGAMIAGGTPTTSSGRLRPGTQYDYPIGPQAYPQAARSAEAQLSQAYDNILNIQRRAGMDRVELQAKQNQLQIDKLLEGLDLEGQLRKRQFDVDLADFDRRMGIMERRRSRKLSGRQIAQIGGAAISGGIFGGPEGFLGGVIGGAFGVGGAFAGAAAGAQVGMLRQQLGVAAKYSAELNLVKTTLAQAVTSQQEYNQALAASRSISKDYSVDLMGTIQGYAQLITAARANNISLSDTEKIYRGVIASGVAFGKSQEDIASMVRATVQILSKGKVTAEELRGQLGERLPGAVPKFAEATGRSMAQLEKDLENGKVSMADFKKFAIQGFIDYDKAAKLIASGPEKAGLRLDNALKEMQAQYGGFFQNVGAAFQDNTTALVNWVNNGGEGLKRYATFWWNLAKFVQDSLNAQGKALGAYYNFWWGKGSIGEKIYGPLLKKLNIDVAVQGLGESVTKGLTDYTSNYKDYFPEFTPTQYGRTSAGAQPGDTTAGTDSKGKKGAADKAAKQALDALRTVLDYSDAVFKASQERANSLYELNKKLTDMETSNRLEALGTIERETAQVLEDRRNKEREFAEERTKLEDKQLEALRAVERARKEAAKGGEASAIQEAQVEYASVTDRLNDLTAAQKRHNAALDEAARLDLTSAFRSRNEELAKTLRLETLRADLQLRGASSSQVQLQLDLAAADEERARRLVGVTALDQITAINTAYQEQVDLLNKIYTLNQANANSFGFREGAQRYVESIGTMRDATAQLTESGLKGLEDVLFQLTTTGTANFQEFAASILQQSARMIMQLLIQKTIMQIIGAIGGGGGGGGGGLGNFGISLPGVGYTAPAFGNANGNVFAANGIVPYAMGGIVNRPTLFPFANGGSIGTGLMGEAGPEAIIPLQRGANGKLGVAGGGGTTNIVVNVDASGGTSVSGDETQAKQLGQVVTAAVQAELLKQKRPGGLLSR